MDERRAGQDLHVPAELRRGQIGGDEEASVDSAVWLIEHMCRHVGVPDLGSLDVLDMGCGVKFTQAILGRGLPVGRYTGLDVSRGIVEYLRDVVDDPRFDFHHLDLHNERYNPDGQPMRSNTPLPVERESFDLVCLFSVFTHLAPDDFVAMLTLLRPYVRPSGHLFFTLFIDKPVADPYGLMAALRDRQPDLPPVLTFRDIDPDKPLLWAVYSEPHARALISGTGWQPIELSTPDEHIQHHFVCVPT